MTNRRLIGFDIARSLAIAGMVIVNFKVAAGVSEGDPGWLQKMVGLIDGRAAALFVILAGVGASLMTATARAERDQKALTSARDTLLRRALFLLVVGYAFIPIWPADILHYYALYIAIGALLLSASDRTLLVLASVLGIVFVALYSVFGYWAELDPITLDYRGFWTGTGLLRNLWFNGWHPVIPWVSFYIFGMWVGRRDVRKRATRQWMLGLGFGMAVVGEAIAAIARATAGATEFIVDVAAAGLSVDAGGRALLDAEPIPPSPPYLLAGAGTALVIAMLCVAWGLRRPDKRVVSWLRRSGELALTMYFAHVIVGLGALEELGLLANGTLPEVVISAVVFYVLAVWAAVWWRSHHDRGPVETLMRRLS